MDAVIGQYADFYSEWFGLEDGTLLECGDSRGRLLRKVGSDEVEEITPDESIILGTRAVKGLL